MEQCLGVGRLGLAYDRFFSVALDDSALIEDANVGAYRLHDREIMANKNDAQALFFTKLIEQLHDLGGSDRI